MKLKEAADLAVKYFNIKEAERILAGELKAAGAVLREYIEEHGEAISVEGQPDLVLQPRTTSWTWDAQSLAAQEPAEYARLLEKGAITVNKAVADELAKAGLITGAYKRFGTSGETRALMFAKR